MATMPAALAIAADLAKSTGIVLEDVVRIENYEWIPEEGIIFQIAHFLHPCSSLLFV